MLTDAPLPYNRQTQSIWVPFFLTGMPFPVATTYVQPVVLGQADAHLESGRLVHVHPGCGLPGHRQLRLQASN
jgi:hypothetical protein